MPRYKDITDRRFGMLVALRPDGKNRGGEMQWFCRCDCGETSSVSGARLRGGYTKSCGCGVRAPIHGMSKHRLHSIWSNMKDRCSNPNCRFYHRYGGRGIAVCREWQESAATFFEWALANGYADDLQIDRINNDGNYEPGNCRFVTSKANNRNRCNTRMVRLHGRDWPLIEVAEKYGIDRSCLENRLDVMGLSVEDALDYDRVKDCYRHNTSGATGVYWHKGAGKWRARIRRGGKHRSLGLFSNFDDAVAARDAALGELARDL